MEKPTVVTDTLRSSHLRKENKIDESAHYVMLLPPFYL